MRWVRSKLPALGVSECTRRDAASEPWPAEARSAKDSQVEGRSVNGAEKLAPVEVGRNGAWLQLAALAAGSSDLSVRRDYVRARGLAMLTTSGLTSVVK